MKLVIYLALLLILYSSCEESDLQKKQRLVSKWCGMEIAFPANILCVSGEDTIAYKIPYADFLIITYADSLGCISFRKNISHWKRLIAKADSLTKRKVSFMFFLRPGDVNEMSYILHKENFFHPVCYDWEGKLHLLNKFPDDLDFRSFLLDANRQVLTVGNPTHDALIEKAYSQIIGGETLLNRTESTTTKVSYDDIYEIGDFDWQSSYRAVISLENTGSKPLVVDDVITSCSCIHIEYNRKPVEPGKKWDLHISYKAGRPEFFKRDIMVYCNTESSPLNFAIRGNAK